MVEEKQKIKQFLGFKCNPYPGDPKIYTFGLLRGLRKNYKQD